MQFRCPNCQHPIRVGDQHDLLQGDELPDAIECPSCHSRISLSAETESTRVATDGMRIGHFEIQATLGEGSFGTVYKAWDEILERNVAIKVPRQGRVTKETARMFLREAQSAADIHHPNVVAVHEIGLHADQYYIATQFIDGITLSEYLRNHSLPIQDAVRLVIKLLKAVQVFHDKKIVHRDLKPGNVLLDGNLEPHISDFGLARREYPNEMTLTRHGDVVGTLHYMSPEQARGDQRSINNRSDIYAIGVILYQLLTGHRPFRASSSQTLLYSILHEHPPTPRKLDRRIPRDLETICLKALQKEAADRYSSASEMAHSLELYLEGRPIPDKPTALSVRALKWVRRNRLLSGITAVALISLFIAAASVTLRPQRPTNSVPVVIGTTPPADEIVFERYDESLRVPHASGFRQTAANAAAVYLLPGLYKVSAQDAAGRYHEVWRTVPEPADLGPVQGEFPHHYYAWNESQQVQLRPFQLWLETQIAEPCLRVPGGTFLMGRDGLIPPAEPHRHRVDDFLIGIDEVNYSRFVEVLSSPVAWDDAASSWLELIDRKYGPRPWTEYEPEEPVTGCTVDVAILYCELAGCRLPTHAEYEFAATLGGTREFPTGASPVVDSADDWKILPGPSSPDESPEGIRNLCFSVAEFTDNDMTSYRQLYPADFQNPERVSPDADFRTAMQMMVEVRGAPGSWVGPGGFGNEPDVRRRIGVQRLPSTNQTELEHVGWRVYRSVPGR